MIKNMEIDEFLLARNSLPTIDVRSPIEFNKGHIPNAINIPLFSDEERARVGTRYKKVGKTSAILLGMELIGPKLYILCKRAKKVAAKNKKIIIHCARGGMRSQSLAWHIEKLDIESVLLTGGYKAYRKKVHDSFDQNLHFKLLTGHTGCGKTEILHEMNSLNQQVIDLEELANHKGSAFGALGKGNQPTTEQFENNLFEKLNTLDADKNIWLEDESRSIGSVIIPENFFAKMKTSPVVKIIMDKEIRTNRLLKEYTTFEKELLLTSVKKIEKRLGGENTKKCISSISQGDFKTAISLTLDYYDKAYSFNLKKRDIEKYITTINLIADTPLKNAKQIIDLLASGSLT